MNEFYIVVQSGNWQQDIRAAWDIFFKAANVAVSKGYIPSGGIEKDEHTDKGKVYYRFYQSFYLSRSRVAEELKDLNSDRDSFPTPFAKG